jgi:hypothetical protein
LSRIPEFNIRLYDKNSESDYFCFPPPKSEYFFQQHGFLFRSEFFFRTTIFFFCREYQNLTSGYMTKTLNQIIFFFLHQNQNIFFSNFGNQNIFLEKNHNPPPSSS